MNPTLPRRSFLRATAAAGVSLALGDLGFPGRLPPVSADEARLEAASVRFRPEIEPLVRLLEDTPRERLLEEVAARIHRGTTYREVLAALLLAGVRNIQPRPVGFKFHAVLVVNSAHLASQNSPDADRWLPIFWALDQFKSSQERDTREGDWTMGPVDEKAVPPPEQAQRRFQEAMDRWEVDQADAAVAGFARSGSAHQVFEVFCRYGARDFRDLGHKAIYVANSWRTLQQIGWQHAEPVLRSLAYALLEHEEGNPADRDAEADRPGRRHDQLARDLRADWQGGALNAAATSEMLGALRSGTWEETGAKTVQLLNRGVAPASIWDALQASAVELLMRKPGIVSLHACTTTNALRYAFENVARDETRRLLILQNAAFIPMFRAHAGEGADRGERIDAYEPAAPDAAGADAVPEIFSQVAHDRLLAARKALAWLGGGGDVRTFVDAAQRLIYLKGTDSHDYKFSSAVLEDYPRLSPGLRDRFLAASVFWLKGSEEPDNRLVARSRAIL